MRRTIIIIAVMFSLVSRFFGQELATFTSPAGFYTVRYPKEWKVSTEGNIVNISPPDSSGAITISAYHGEGASSERAEEVILRTFKDYEAVSPLHPKTLNNWTGLASELVQSDAAGKRVWLVVGACRDKVLVLITANDTEQAMKPRKATYQSILDSLVVTDPEAKNQ